MTDDWQAGDLAVCIGPSDHPNAWTPAGPTPTKGSTYRVIDVISRSDWIALVLDGFLAPHWTRGWSSRCFRKVSPDKHEDCEPEFVELLKRIKVTA